MPTGCVSVEVVDSPPVGLTEWWRVGDGGEYLAGMRGGPSGNSNVWWWHDRKDRRIYTRAASTTGNKSGTVTVHDQLIPIFRELTFETAKDTVAIVRWVNVLNAR